MDNQALKGADEETTFNQDTHTTPKRQRPSNDLSRSVERRKRLKASRIEDPTETKVFHLFSNYANAI